MPDIDVVVEQAMVGDEDFGNWSFSLRPLDEGLRVTDLTGRFRHLTIKARDGSAGASLYWNWEDGQEFSGLDARVESDDIAAAFSAWGQPAAADARATVLDLGLQWHGTPTDFDAARLGGWAELELRDGRLLDVDNSPALRFIGVLNFNEILRRLRFDFDDFFKSGLAFDRFGGRLLVESGLVSISKPIELKGPSSRFHLTGGANLRDRTIDAELLATLPLGSNLPWVAALAGGPAVAAGVYVASRLFEEQMGRFSSARYRVSGTLDAPDVRLDRVVKNDTGEAVGAADGQTQVDASAPQSNRQPGGVPEAPVSNEPPSS